MRALINATTIRFGGGLQVAVSVLRHALADQGDWDWQFAISGELAHELRQFDCLDHNRVVVFDRSPARSRAAREKLKQLEASLLPASILTVFGPSYVDFEAPHLMGVADGWVTHSDKMAFGTLHGPFAIANMAARCMHKAFWYRGADAWWVEAECSRAGLHQRLRMPRERITVIPNTCSQDYLIAQESPPPPDPSAPIRILTFATDLPNKNLTILPRIAAELRHLCPDREFRFLTTLDSEGAEWKRIERLAVRLGVRHSLENLGPIPIADGPSVYRQCDLCLATTLLETASAFYPEAMAMGRPMITTDLPFAHDACGESALYFSPRNATDAALKIRRLVNDPDAWIGLRDLGKQRLASMPSPRDRFIALKDSLSQLAGIDTGDTQARLAA